ncbi:outer membrane protein assembly factor BamC [Thiohalocapsa marina]|uniref:Outer membrane protein assembly factor BamC n=2 Tax=Thiohalocapsa marina TaxID=424902 RepID=A0A5M8FM91_9GAMM|nr:outer membrane protein assembly factor BamC [Thiohalocapsa marina]
MQAMHRFIPLLVLPLLVGCGASKTVEKILPDQTLEYKKQREASENLELPPDLAGATFDDVLDIPSASGTTTYSDYAGGRAARRQVASSGEVLPEVSGVSLERSGDRRWLKVEASPQTVWPKVVGFWREQGILLLEQDPAVGVMKTDWLENRAEIRKDFVTRQLRKIVDGLYATSTRDQFRVRIDAGSARNTTEIYLSHRAMEERLVRNTVGEGSTTVWEPAPSDPEVEAAMLRRLMLYLGVSDGEASRMLAASGGSAATTSRTVGARLVQSGGGSELVIPTEFRQAWRRTGLALDRTGFAVEDRNRSEGVFYVRYDDPTRDGKKKTGMLSRMAFWSDGSSKKGPEQYRVKLVGGADETRVTVLDAAGQRDTSPTAEQILSLLHEQLR